MANWNIVEKARRNPEATLAAALVLMAQIPHAHYVFLQNGHTGTWAGELNAWVYAIAVESAVFFFVLRGWAWVSWGFALASIGINVAYYSLAHGDVHGHGFMFDLRVWTITWSMWLLSFVLPIAVAAFSHATADVDTDKSHKWTRTQIDHVGRVQGLWARLTGHVDQDDLDTPDTPVTPFSVDTPDMSLDTMVDSGLDMSPDTMGDSGLDMSPDTMGDSGLDTPVTPFSVDTPDMSPDTMDDSGLDSVDREILGHLSGGPMTVSEIAKSVDMSAGAMYRKRGGKVTGRLVNLESGGHVKRNGDGKWTVTNVPLWATLETVSTNGNGSG